MPPVGFEPTISAGERPQTYALDRAATGIGVSVPVLTLMGNFWIVPLLNSLIDMTFLVRALATLGIFYFFQ